MLPQLANWGLVDQVDFEAGRVVLTQRGRLMADAVVKELLAAASPLILCATGRPGAAGCA